MKVSSLYDLGLFNSFHECTRTIGLDFHNLPIIGY